MAIQELKKLEACRLRYNYLQHNSWDKISSVLSFAMNKMSSSSNLQSSLLNIKPMITIFSTVRYRMDNISKMVPGTASIAS
ncbi:hypothetical protein Plhal304r1_c026g0087551 [Plasmopara halstedii]